MYDYVYANNIDYLLSPGNIDFVLCCMLFCQSVIHIYSVKFLALKLAAGLCFKNTFTFDIFFYFVEND